MKPSSRGDLAANVFSLPAQSPLSRVRPIDTETKMIGIWREILQVPDIGPTSNFFELGGHSLMAMRLVTKVARIFDVKINVMSLFQTPTVREFAARVSGGLVSRSKLGISSKFSHSVIRRPSSP